MFCSGRSCSGGDGSVLTVEVHLALVEKNGNLQRGTFDAVWVYPIIIKNLDTMSNPSPSMPYISYFLKSTMSVLVKITLKSKKYKNRKICLVGFYCK